MFPLKQRENKLFKLLGGGGTDTQPPKFVLFDDGVNAGRSIPAKKTITWKFTPK